ncbi:protein RTM1 [Aspergillus lentulus]|nr:protein RTM1 [Aspergillus lentulus]
MAASTVAAKSAVVSKIVFAGFSTHSLTTCDDGIVYWFAPNTGEICDPLDCGGGRAPPKTNVLGCAGYTGTYVPTASYLSCWTPPASATSTPVTVTSAESTRTRSQRARAPLLPQLQPGVQRHKSLPEAASRLQPPFL